MPMPDCFFWCCVWNGTGPFDICDIWHNETLFLSGTPYSL